LCLKKSIEEKYKGGVEGFKKDFEFESSVTYQEDRSLFSIGHIDEDAFDINKLIRNGLSYDEEGQFSIDLVITYRYGENLWEVDWIRDNKVFAWHKSASEEEFKQVEEISEMPFNQWEELMNLGKNPFQSIWV
jgi:hypothetical protein